MSRPQGETRELTVVLTEVELVEAGTKLCEAVQDADDHESYMEERKGQWRETLKALKDALSHKRKTASELAEIVRTGKDKRDVACTWLYALAAGYAFLVRDDTQELVTHRKLRDEERQLSIGEAPFREPTPEQLAEWLTTLPVNEPDALGEGHAETVTAGERLVGALLDPEADESFGPSSDELTEPVPGFEEWAAEMAEDPNDIGDDRGDEADAAHDGTIGLEEEF